MKLPINISIMETAFTLPWSNNLTDIHKQVYDVILEGKNIPSNIKTRPFLFDVTVLDADNGIALVVARGQKLAESLSPESSKITVTEGDKLSVLIKLSAARRFTEVKGESVRRTERLVPDDELEEFAGYQLKRSGMTVSSLNIDDINLHHVVKGKNRFVIKEITVTADVIVDCGVTFTQAYLGGVGRHKGYGFGKIEIKE